jgi:hypothetical protein
MKEVTPDGDRHVTTDKVCVGHFVPLYADYLELKVRVNDLNIVLIKTCY